MKTQVNRFALKSGLGATTLIQCSIGNYWLRRKARILYDEDVVRTTRYGDDPVAVTEVGRWIYFSRSEERILFVEHDIEKIHRLWERYKRMLTSITHHLGTPVVTGGFEIIQDFESRID